jgi:hypothetical protein
MKNVQCVAEMIANCSGWIIIGNCARLYTNIIIIFVDCKEVAPLDKMLCQVMKDHHQFQAKKGASQKFPAYVCEEAIDLNLERSAQEITPSTRHPCKKDMLHVMQIMGCVIWKFSKSEGHIKLQNY